MIYEAFKTAMYSKVVEEVGEEVDVRMHKITKNNGIVLDAITIMAKGAIAAPTLYFRDFFERYKNGESFFDLVQNAISFSMEAQLKLELPDDFFMDFEKVKDRICYKVINYERNLEFLKNVPHKRILDLAMVFYYMVQPELMNHATMLIRNSDLQRWAVTEESLSEAAAVNTPNLLGWRFASVQDVVDELFCEGLDEALNVIDHACEIVRTEKDAVPMYILTNQQRYLGAGCILYPGLLECIADMFESDLFILPSSVHECILVPDLEEYSMEGLSAMVKEINEREVEEMEILADHAYRYSRETQKIDF